MAREAWTLTDFPPFEEPETYSPEDRLVVALNEGLLAETFAGVWEDGAGLHVAVTRNVVDARRRLAAVAPDGVFEVTRAARTLAELEGLLAMILSDGQRLRAPLSSLGIDEMNNCLDVALETLDASSSQALRQQFSAAPVRWREGRIVFLTG